MVELGDFASSAYLHFFFQNRSWANNAPHPKRHMSSALRSYSTWKVAKGALFALPKQMPGTCLLSLSKHLCQDISSSAYCPHETMGLTFFSPHHPHTKCWFKLNAATKPREESYKLKVRGSHDGVPWIRIAKRKGEEAAVSKQPALI